MRISRRIAVTGKMFDRGQHPALVRALDIGCDQIADLLWIFAKRARVDDGIGWVGIHVSVGKKIPVNADSARFFGGDATEPLSVFGLSISTEGHGVGKSRGSHQSHRNSTFKICGKEQRKFRVALEAIE